MREILIRGLRSDRIPEFLIVEIEDPSNKARISWMNVAKETLGQVISLFERDVFKIWKVLVVKECKFFEVDRLVVGRND